MRRVAIALLVTLAGGSAALALVLLGMVGGAGCASEEVARAPDGAWRIERTDCGATVGFSWRVLLRGTDGRERMALETTPYPEAVSAELAAGVLRVRLADTAAARDVRIDPERRPVAPVRLYEGHPRR
jgi:hypothetical protein